MTQEDLFVTLSREDADKVVHFLETFVNCYLRKENTASAQYAIDSIEDVIQRIEK